MSLSIREGRPADAAECGRICHDAFEAISAQHGFPKDFPSREAGVAVAGSLLDRPGIYAVVAERDGRIVGSNFLDERGSICGVGPIAVDPGEQDGSVGRRLMQRVLDRAAERGRAGVRLLQDAFHNRSFVLYTKLGFRARGTTAVMQGPPLGGESSDVFVRTGSKDDRDACNALCRRVHGHDRSPELDDAIDGGRALVAERSGGVVGYTTGVSFFGHSVALSSDDLKPLVRASASFPGPGFHVPTNDDELLRWCFANGLRMAKAMTLMTTGLYNEPRGAYLPSVLY